MRKQLATVALICLISISNIPRSYSAPKNVNSDKATLNSKCIEKKSISLSKSGPLICEMGVWKSIVKNQDSVATRAYRSLLNRYKSKPEIYPNLTLRVDPNAGAWKNQIVNGFIAAARLWGTSTSIDPALPLYISENPQYISENLAKDGITENPEDAERNRSAVANGRSQAGSHGTYFDFIFSEQNSHDSGFYQVGPHEYTHYAQKVFANGLAFQSTREFWIEEGCATFVGTSMGGIVGLPQNQREDLVRRIQSQPSATKISEFSNIGPEIYQNPKFNEVYANGSIACEAIVAVAGLDSIEKLYRELSKEGLTYDKASQVTFNMNLNSLVNFVQLYVDSVRRAKPMSLDLLIKTYYELQSKG